MQASIVPLSAPARQQQRNNNQIYRNTLAGMSDQTGCRAYLARKGYDVEMFSQERFEEALELFVYCYTQKQVVLRHLGTTQEEFEPFARRWLENALTNPHPINALLIERNTDKVVAVYIAEDYVANQTTRKVNYDGVPLSKNVRMFMNFTKRIESKLNKDLANLFGDKTPYGKFAYQPGFAVATSAQGVGGVFWRACFHNLIENGFWFFMGVVTHPKMTELTQLAVRQVESEGKICWVNEKLPWSQVDVAHPETNEIVTPWADMKNVSKSYCYLILSELYLDARKIVTGNTISKL